MLSVEAPGKYSPLFSVNDGIFQREGCDDIFFLLYDAIIGGTKNDLNQLLAPATGRSLSFSGIRNVDQEARTGGVIYKVFIIVQLNLSFGKLE